MSVLWAAGLLQPSADKVLVFGGMAQHVMGMMYLLPDMFELSISQRWWRQARPHPQRWLWGACCKAPRDQRSAGAAQKRSTASLPARAVHGRP